jgi:hypothetical protein
MDNALPRRTPGAPRTWQLCMTSENHGTVGPAGCTFSHAPEKHERVLVVEVPAAANKAAEEGGLLRYEIASNGLSFLDPEGSWVAYGDVVADRASRQVANKAEVDLDTGFLQWIHDRMRFVHGENENVDYMHKLRAIIASVPVSRDTPNVASIAIPPATTGASTVLTDERMPVMYAAKRIDNGEYGSLLHRSEESAYRHNQHNGPAAPKYTVVAMREVAAQAGQVAVPEIDLSTLDRYIIQDGEDERPDIAKAAKGGLVLFSDVEDILSNAGQALKAKPAIWVDINSIEDTGLLFGTTRHLTVTGSSEKFGDYTTPLYAAPSPAKESLEPNQVQTIAERLKNTAGLPAKESK